MRHEGTTRDAPPEATTAGPIPPSFMVHPSGERRRKGTIAQLPRRATDKPRPAEPVYRRSCWACTSPHCAYNAVMTGRRPGEAPTAEQAVADLTAHLRERTATQEDITAVAQRWGADVLAAALADMDPA